MNQASKGPDHAKHEFLFPVMDGQVETYLPSEMLNLRIPALHVQPDELPQPQQIRPLPHVLVAQRERLQDGLSVIGEKMRAYVVGSPYGWGR